jgi:hypothetical protein
MPVHVYSDRSHLAVQDIRQVVEICAPYDKMNKLQDYLRSKPRGYKTIVFCGTKRMCDQARPLPTSLPRHVSACAPRTLIGSLASACRASACRKHLHACRVHARASSVMHAERVTVRLWQQLGSHALLCPAAAS